MNKRQKYDTFKEECANCRACSLRKDNENIVPIVSDGSIHSDVMIVGDYPGFYDNVYNTPFVNKASKIIKYIIQASGAKSVYYTNIIKCFPANGKPITQETSDKCSYWLKRELSIVRPSVVLSLGESSSRYLLTNDRFGIDIKNFDMNQVRGNRYANSRYPTFIPTWHPGDITKNKEKIYELWEDVQTAFQLTTQ